MGRVCSAHCGRGFRRLYERGRRLATRLAQLGSQSVLLHGDLTPSNILDGGHERGLVAIDPAPCVGTLQVAAATGCDGDRLLAWCAAFAAMNALDLAIEGGPYARIEACLELASQTPAN